MGEPVAPSKQPEWADGGSAVIVEPTTPYKQAGWTAVKPPLGFFNWWQNLVFQWTTFLQAKMALFVGYAADTVLTVASNAIIPTQGNHLVDTSGGAVTVNFISTANLGSGRLLVLTGNNPSGNPVTIANNAGSPPGGTLPVLTSDGNSIVLVANQVVTLKNTGSAWQEVSRAIPPSDFSVTGSMMMYGGSAAPSGWLLCQGQSLSTSTYSALFAAIGYGFGGSGGSFSLPDMRNKFPIGAGTNTALGANGAASTDNIDSHNHGSFNLNNNVSGSTVTYGGSANAGQHAHAVVIPLNVGLNYIIKT